MEIHHKVKPLHGWREFFGEVGIIVLGVLIALGAEQLVETIHWRHQVAETYDSLGEELGLDFATLVVRINTYQCVNDRLDEIGRIVAAAEKSGRLPPIGSIGYAVSSDLASGVWRGAIASGISAHIPRKDQLWLGNIYGQIEELHATNVAELDTWSALYQISGPGGAVAPETTQHLRELLSRARFYNVKIANYGAQLLMYRHDAPFPIDQRYIDKIATAPRARWTPCRPTPARTAKVYGQAPWREYYEQFMIEQLHDRRAAARKEKR